MSRDSIYDSVFKTMTQKMPHLLVPLVNYVFGTEFPEDVEVVCMGEEYEGKVKKRIADSVFRIEGRIFHIECQSQWDPNMAMRMDRYDREIAHEEAEARRECHRLKLPESCVIFLRNARSMPLSFPSKSKSQTARSQGTGHRPSGCSRCLWTRCSRTGSASSFPSGSCAMREYSIRLQLTAHSKDSCLKSAESFRHASPKLWRMALPRRLLMGMQKAAAHFSGA